MATKNATRTPAAVATQPASAPDLGEREIRIKIWLDHWVHFEGAAAQLQAEGLIPKDFEWPRAADDKRWEVNGFDYWLCRSRPEGHKGPMRSWLGLDNWFVRVSVTGRDCHWRNRRSLERKAEELRAEYHRLTAAGSAKWEADCTRYWAAAGDKKFQAFKAMIPGLIPPKRGRKPALRLVQSGGPG